MARTSGEAVVLQPPVLLARALPVGTVQRGHSPVPESLKQEDWGPSPCGRPRLGGARDMGFCFPGPRRTVSHVGLCAEAILSGDTLSPPQLPAFCLTAKNPRPLRWAGSCPGFWSEPSVLSSLHLPQSMAGACLPADGVQLALEEPALNRPACLHGCFSVNTGTVSLHGWEFVGVESRLH